MKEDPKEKRSLRTPRSQTKEKVGLKESRNPKNDQTQAEALKGVKPDRPLMKESP